jgi:hypothetical protein
MGAYDKSAVVVGAADDVRQVAQKHENPRSQSDDNKLQNQYVVFLARPGCAVKDA